MRLKSELKRAWRMMMWTWVGVRGVSLLALWAGCLWLIGCGPATFVVGVSPGDQRLVRSVVIDDGQWRGDRVAIVDITGLIYNANKPGFLREGENPVSVLHEKLEEAAGDPKIKAIILRLNTPGGTVTASDAMYRTVNRFRAQTGKPVVALMMDVAASGGYYVACAADIVMAHPTTVTGSIGVLFQTVSFKPALGRVGIQAEAFTSGPNKDAGSMLSSLTDEQREVLQGLVDDFYQRFLAVVRQARPSIPADRFGHVTDGRVVSGTAALGLGLVDQTGDLYDAFERAMKEAKLTTADLVIYHRPLEYVGSPYAAMPHHPLGTGIGGGTQINLAQLNLSDRFMGRPAGFYYLWDMEVP